jgi:hypothetical protein
MAYVLTMHFGEEPFEGRVKDMTDDELDEAMSTAKSAQDYEKVLIISIEIKRRQLEK